MYRSLYVQALTNLLWSLTADVVQREGYIQLNRVSSNSYVLSLSLSRYDYLQFTDVSGEKKTFDDVYGSDHWAAVSQ